jgi:hypothetical protein
MEPAAAPTHSAEALADVLPAGTPSPSVKMRIRYYTIAIAGPRRCVNETVTLILQLL